MTNVTLIAPLRPEATWLTPPTAEYVNHGRSKSRDDVSVDSVVGKELALRVSAPAAYAHIAFGIEAGTQDASKLIFSVDGKPLKLEWLDFDPPAEPRTAPRPEMRLFTSTFKVTNGKLDLKWSNPSDPVHLISLQVIPLSTATVTNASLRQVMEKVGDTAKMERIDGARDSVSPALSNDHARVRFWLDTMADADRYFEGYRGWTWADEKTGLSMFGRYSQAVMWLDGLLADPAFRTSPLYKRALLQRARLQYGLWLEGADRGPMQAAANRDWSELARLKVRPDLTPMYLGGTIKHASPCDALSVPRGTPVWASRQRESLCRLDELLAWWVDHRQAANGELGGKWGDDVEMLRWWQVPLLAGSPKAWTGWSRVANGVWASDLISDGYHRKISDVEHAAEPISDTHLIYALSDDPTLRARLAPAARQFVSSWTRPVGTGERRFRSAWFGTEGVDERPPRNRDVQMNARAAKSVRFYIDGNDDAVVRQALVDWSRMWAKATLSTDKGKPRGVVPPSIRFADGKINGDEPTWYRANMFWDYFDWSGEGQIYDQMLHGLTLSDDPDIRAALLSAFDFAASSRSSATGAGEVGSEAWAAKDLLGSETFQATWGQWRLTTGDTRYDAVLTQVTPSRYLKYRLTGNEAPLAGASQRIIDRLRVNWPMLTSEVIFTDRVYAAGKGNQADYADMIAMMTGALSTESPYFHVTWHDRAGDLAFLVRDARANGLKLDIAAFGKNARTTAKFWRLEKGDYCLGIRDPGGRLSRQRLTIARRGQAHGFTLPTQGTYKVELEPIGSTGCA